mmetsp:Transcript_8321/g.32807  ORF Transcript_8321/g.32807 Transcript_8321/m.32807 type:complete len:362 (-) Transcript_8321:117-1202(-)
MIAAFGTLFSGHCCNDGRCSRPLLRRAQRAFILAQRYAALRCGEVPAGDDRRPGLDLAVQQDTRTPAIRGVAAPQGQRAHGGRAGDGERPAARLAGKLGDDKRRGGHGRQRESVRARGHLQQGSSNRHGIHGNACLAFRLACRCVDLDVCAGERCQGDPPCDAVGGPDQARAQKEVGHHHRVRDGSAVRARTCALSAALRWREPQELLARGEGGEHARVCDCDGNGEGCCPSEQEGQPLVANEKRRGALNPWERFLVQADLGLLLAPSRLRNVAKVPQDAHAGLDAKAGVPFSKKARRAERIHRKSRHGQPSGQRGHGQQTLRSKGKRVKPLGVGSGPRDRGGAGAGVVAVPVPGLSAARS